MLGALDVPIMMHVTRIAPRRIETLKQVKA
jgi:hypothetical protein